MSLCLEDIIYGCDYKGEREDWIYAGNGKYRYVLGRCGDDPLICFGINPSDAHIAGVREKGIIPQVKPDPTMHRVRNISRLLGFDGYIMLNLCPYINKDPSVLRGLGEEYSEENDELNLRYIEKVFEKYRDSRILWACWGKSIVNGSYLVRSLERINEVVKKYNKIWKTVRWTDAEPRHPHHPLRISDDEVMKAKNDFSDVDMIRYIRMLQGEK